MKKDILTLIEGDIVNTKLINTFRGIGIDADDYLTDSSTVIFRMLKIPKEKRTDEFYESYFKLLKLGQKLDFKNRKQVRTLAKKIYFLLKNREV